MPRFFFDVEHVARVPDIEGTELPDRETARLYALGIVETVADHRFAGVRSQSRVIIKDEAGEVVATVPPE